MAVKSVKERTERRRSSYRDGKTVHTRVFLVECTASSDGTAVALTASDGATRIPGPGEYFNGVPFSGKDADAVATRIGQLTVDHALKGIDSSTRRKQEEAQAQILKTLGGAVFGALTQKKQEQLPAPEPEVELAEDAVVEVVDGG